MSFCIVKENITFDGLLLLLNLSLNENEKVTEYLSNKYKEYLLDIFLMKKVIFKLILKCKEIVMNWQKNKISNDQAEIVNAQEPVIISASRSTDIPAFYADWFVERWKKGYIKWTNPFNGNPLYVSFSKSRVVVFWSKNPRPMMKYLEFLDREVGNYYFQFTLNDYDDEGLEGKVPKLENRIKTFIDLSKRIGKEKVIWRFDPMILTDSISVEDLLAKVENIGNQVSNYTKKLIFSFADISIYRKVENNLKKEKVKYVEFTKNTMHQFAEGLQKLNVKWGLELATCAEDISLENYGINHNKCIDDHLMAELFSQDKRLMDFLGVEVQEPSLFEEFNNQIKTTINKDKGQRDACGCVMSKDIGQYNTCPHECVYCYANTSKEKAQSNFKSHLKQPFSDKIIGE